MNTKQEGNANIQTAISYFSNLLSKNEIKKDYKTKDIPVHAIMRDGVDVRSTHSELLLKTKVSDFDAPEL